jgi:hypothetical protein
MSRTFTALGTYAAKVGKVIKFIGLSLPIVIPSKAGIYSILGKSGKNVLIAERKQRKSVKSEKIVKMKKFKQFVKFEDNYLTKWMFLKKCSSDSLS